MQFYNVKKRAKVQIPDGKIKKTVYGKGNRQRYAVRAVDDDGTHLTKFVSKEMFDKLNVPVE
jgi:hypothetical protein